MDLIFIGLENIPLEGFHPHSHDVEILRKIEDNVKNPFKDYCFIGNNLIKIKIPHKNGMYDNIFQYNFTKKSIIWDFQSKLLGEDRFKIYEREIFKTVADKHTQGVIIITSICLSNLINIFKKNNFKVIQLFDTSKSFAEKLEESGHLIYKNLYLADKLIPLFDEKFLIEFGFKNIDLKIKETLVNSKSIDKQKESYFLEGSSISYLSYGSFNNQFFDLFKELAVILPNNKFYWVSNISSEYPLIISPPVIESDNLIIIKDDHKLSNPVIILDLQIDPNFSKPNFANYRILQRILNYNSLINNLYEEIIFSASSEKDIPYLKKLLHLYISEMNNSKLNSKLEFIESEEESLIKYLLNYQL